MSGERAQRERLRVVSWNIHGCVGTDGRFDPERTAGALAQLRPDVALLQEVGDNRGVHPPVDQAMILADTLGMTSVLGTTLQRSAFGYGSVTLTRLPIAASETYDLSVRGREPRVCLCVAVVTGGAQAAYPAAAAGGRVFGDERGGGDAARGADLLRTVNLHLGLGRRERRTQLGILLDEAGPLLEDPSVPTLIGGDLNDWPPGSVTQALESLFVDAARQVVRRPPATFPSRRPLLRLDRVFVSAAVEVVGSSVAATPAARLASDHLPLVVDIAVVHAASDRARGGPSDEREPSTSAPEPSGPATATSAATPADAATAARGLRRSAP